MRIEIYLVLYLMMLLKIIGDNTEFLLNIIILFSILESISRSVLVACLALVVSQVSHARLFFPLTTNLVMEIISPEQVII